MSLLHLSPNPISQQEVSALVVGQHQTTMLIGPLARKSQNWRNFELANQNHYHSTMHRGLWPGSLHSTYWSTWSLPFPKTLETVWRMLCASQASSTRCNRADMVCSRSLVPQIIYLLQGYHHPLPNHQWFPAISKNPQAYFSNHYFMGTVLFARCIFYPLMAPF